MFETGTATDYADLLEKLDAFLTTNGSAFGLTYAGTGTGALSGYRGGPSSVAETFTITATSATNWTVVGSISGSIGPATTGTPFSHAKLAFTITAGGTAFVAGDVFTLSTAPKWTSQRKARGCTVSASSGTTGQQAAENVIDGKIAGDGTRAWQGGAPSSQQIEFTFFAAETIVEYALLCDSSLGPRTWTFEYWTGSAWSTLDTRTLIAWGATAAFQTFAITSPVSATRYRLNITAGYGGSNTQIHAVELRRTTGGFNAAFSQYVWSAPGNDGTGAFLMGAHHFRRLDADYYDWELAAFDGFSAAASWRAQSNFAGEVYLPLASSSIPYWFVCNGRRAIVVAKVNTQYEVAYLGAIDPFFTPAQMPYPMALGGTLAHGTNPTWENTAWRWSNTTDAHRAFTHSDKRGAGTPPNNVFHLRARRLDGTWKGFIASNNDSLAIGSLDAAEGFIWPYAGDFNLLDANLDGTYALWPVQLHDATPNVLGQLDGVSMVTGQGMTAESTVKVGAVNHLVVPNITRTDRNDWLAVRLD